MARSRKEDTKTKAERLQTILRLVQEHPISRQEVLLEHLRNEGFEVTQATVSRDIRELCLVKAATTEGYRYVSSRNESFNPKTQGRFETIFHESEYNGMLWKAFHKLRLYQIPRPRYLDLLLSGSYQNIEIPGSGIGFLAHRCFFLHSVP